MLHSPALLHSHRHMCNGILFPWQIDKQLAQALLLQATCWCSQRSEYAAADESQQGMIVQLSVPLAPDLTACGMKGAACCFERCMR